MIFSKKQSQLTQSFEALSLLCSCCEIQPTPNYNYLYIIIIFTVTQWVTGLWWFAHLCSGILFHCHYDFKICNNYICILGQDRNQIFIFITKHKWQKNFHRRFSVESFSIKLSDHFVRHSLWCCWTVLLYTSILTSSILFTPFMSMRLS